MGNFAYQESLDQATFGGQKALIVTSTTATGITIDSAQFPRLIDLVDLPDGDYFCRVPIGGLTSLNLHLTATFAAGTVTSDANTCFLLKTNTIGDSAASAAPYRYQDFTGVGALATTTRQTSTVAATSGEQFAIVKITVAGGAAPTFTQAEINGPR